mmetsp:Transcript_12173/g.30808  ORF Transcript_12173/g.30808 Transcript_12173/m.30808 type:complete len:278 (-) Transcript_12173:922-1755(-)
MECSDLVPLEFVLLQPRPCHCTTYDCKNEQVAFAHRYILAVLDQFSSCPGIFLFCGKQKLETGGRNDKAKRPSISRLIQCCSIFPGIQCLGNFDGSRCLPPGDAQCKRLQPKSYDMDGGDSVWNNNWDSCRSCNRLHTRLFRSVDTESYYYSYVFKFCNGFAPQCTAIDGVKSSKRPHLGILIYKVNGLDGKLVLSHLHTSRSHWSIILQTSDCWKAMGRCSSRPGIFFSLFGIGSAFRSSCPKDVFESQNCWNHMCCENQHHKKLWMISVKEESKK